jgi:hypothetical protein
MLRVDGIGKHEYRFRTPSDRDDQQIEEHGLAADV